MTTLLAFVATVLCAQLVYGSYPQGHQGGSYGHGGGYGHGVYFYDDHDHLYYHGPTAIPHVLPDGHIADTHEVAAAKAEHYTAVAKAKAHSGYGGSYGYGGDYGHGGAQGYGGGYGYGGAQGYGGSYGYDWSQVYGGDYSYGGARGYVGNYEHSAGYQATPYHGPLAKPAVLKSGYLADTLEVATAKQRHLYALHSAQHSSYHEEHH